MNLDWLDAQRLNRLPEFLTALAIGFLIGAERERNPTAKARLRTFALVALAGCCRRNAGRRACCSIDNWSGTRRDLVSMLQFAVVAFVVLPLLPDRPFR